MSASIQIKKAEKAEEYTKLTPGVGTDVFIRKRAPGSQVGEGYIIDIYENGVKIDTLTKENKKETLELIREFKEKYQTDRAFQNELQVHITYKTKEERGELAMTSLDNQLMRKASEIQTILTRLLNPDMPVVTRIAQEDVGGVESIPTTPGTGIDKEQIKNFMLDEIMKKFTGFVKEKVQMGSPVDEIYNSLKKWYGKLTDNILMFNRQVAASYNERTAEGEQEFTKSDLQPIIDESTKVLTSGDPQLISEATGIQVDQAVADMMREVGTKSVGKPGEAEQGGELGGDPATSKTKEEATANDKTSRTIKGAIEDDLFAFEKRVQSFGSTRPISDIAKDLGLDAPEKVQAMHSLLLLEEDPNEAQVAIRVWAEDEIRSNIEASEKVKEFWKYASNSKGVHAIDELFIEWLSHGSVENIEESQRVWDGICMEVEAAFGNKKADYARDGIARILMSFFDSTSGMEKIILDAYLDYRPSVKTLDSVPTTDLTNGQIAYDLLKSYLGGELIEDAGAAIIRADQILDTIKANPSILQEIANEAGVTGDVRVSTQLKLPDRVYSDPGMFEQIKTRYPEIGNLAGRTLDDSYTIGVEAPEWKQQAY